MIKLNLFRFGGRGASSIKAGKTYDIFSAANKDERIKSASGKEVLDQFHYDRNNKVWRDQENNKYIVRSKGLMMTVAARNSEGKLEIIQNDRFANRDDITRKLKAKGFRVLKIWNGTASKEKIKEWANKNRKK